MGKEENVVLRPMECLPPTVIIYLKTMNNYFITSHLLTHLGVRNVQATDVLKKNRLCKCTIIRGKQPQINGL